MKSINGFLLVSYLSSIVETAALLVLPLASMYLMVQVDVLVGTLALVVGAIAAALALTGLASLESAIAEHLDDQRMIRRNGAALLGLARRRHARA